MIRWHYRRWRARHYVWAADLEYRRRPTPRNLNAWQYAIRRLTAVEANRP